jgi:hypothetical protein
MTGVSNFEVHSVYASNGFYNFLFEGALAGTVTNTYLLGTNLYAFYTDDIFRNKIFTSHHPEFVDSNEKKGWIVNHATVIYKLDSVIKCGGYDEGFRRAQDIDLWKRMNKAGCIFRNIPDVLCGWRRYR